MKRSGRVCVVVFFALLFFPYQLAFSKRKPRIFHPQMEPAKGEWGAPHMHVGEKPAAKWSEETINSAVKKKPIKGRLVTRSGEIIDVGCYLQLGKHGKPHAGCGKACLMNGHAVGLLTAKGHVYLLFPEEHNARKTGQTTLRQVLIHHVSEIVEVTGTLTNVKGQKAIYVQGFVKKNLPSRDLSNKPK